MAYPYKINSKGETAGKHQREVLGKSKNPTTAATVNRAQMPVPSNQKRRPTLTLNYKSSNDNNKLSVKPSVNGRAK